MSIGLIQTLYLACSSVLAWILLLVDDEQYGISIFSIDDIQLHAPLAFPNFGGILR
jgi:hypothetical protein